MKRPFWWDWPYGFRLWLFGWVVVVGLLAYLVAWLT
jgi:hypothetical protein